MSDYSYQRISYALCRNCWLFPCACKGTASGTKDDRPAASGAPQPPAPSADDRDTRASDFGQVITMDPMKFAERVFRSAAAAKAHAKSILDRYEECECPAILGPEVLDILEACDVMRAKVDDPELAECLTATESRCARGFLAIVERMRGDLLTLTRSGDFPEDGVVVVIE